METLTYERASCYYWSWKMKGVASVRRKGRSHPYTWWMSFTSFTSGFTLGLTGGRTNQHLCVVCSPVPVQGAVQQQQQGDPCRSGQDWTHPETELAEVTKLDDGQNGGTAQEHGDLEEKEDLPLKWWRGWKIVRGLTRRPSNYWGFGSGGQVCHKDTECMLKFLFLMFPPLFFYAVFLLIWILMLNFPR